MLADTDLAAPAAEKAVHDLIRERMGADLVVIGRAGEDLDRVLEENPFREGYDRSRVFFVFFPQPVPEAEIRRLRSRNFLPEELVLSGDSAILYIPGPYGRGTLSAGFLEKELGIPATMRNFNTVSRLAALSRE